MLLFNCCLGITIRGVARISIYPMLLFNHILWSWLQSRKAISIHPMLLFNLSTLFKNSTVAAYFNTSYVIIQHYKCINQTYVDYYFNTSYVIIQPTKNRHSCILLISINHDLKPFSNILPTIPLKISYS